MQSFGTRRLAAGLTVGLLSLTACTNGQEADPGTVDGPTIVVASFNFAESEILAEIYAQRLEQAGFDVDRQLNLGARELIFPQLAAGDLGLLPEYLGSALVVGFGEETPDNLDDGVAALQQAFAADGVSVLTPAPAENKNVFVTATAFAEANDLHTVADLADAGAVTLAGPPECQDRDTCYRGLTDVYGLDNLGFSSIQEGSARLAALTGGEVQLALFFSTDAFLADPDLRVLDDPQGIVPPENIVPVISTALVDAYGDDLTSLLDSISERLTTDALIELNGRAAEGTAPATIAADWLEQNLG